MIPRDATGWPISAGCKVAAEPIRGLRHVRGIVIRVDGFLAVVATDRGSRVVPAAWCTVQRDTKPERDRRNHQIEERANPDWRTTQAARDWT